MDVSVTDTGRGTTSVKLDFSPKVDGANIFACDSIISGCQKAISTRLGGGKPVGNPTSTKLPAPPWWLLALSALALIGLYTNITKGNSMNTLHAAFQKLGVHPGMTFEILKQRYKTLLLVWHPDRMTTDKDRKVAEEELKNINNAFDCIKKHFQSGHRQGPNCECQPEAIGNTANPKTGGQARSNSNKSSDTASGKSEAQQDYDERLRKEAEARKQAEENLRKEQAARAQEAERRRQAEEAHQAAIKEALERARQDAAAKATAATAAKAKSLDDAVLREKVAAAFAVIFVILLAVGSIHKDAPSLPSTEWPKVEHLRPSPFQ